MSDNDLIRRGDALAVVQEWTYCCDAEDAIAALPAVTQPMPDLSDPVTVHANMLRGTIAKPTLEQIIHLYGVDALTKALASIEYERKVAQMKEDFPNGI